MTKATFCFQKGNIQYSQGAGSRFLFLLLVKAIVEWDFQGALCSVMLPLNILSISLSLSYPHNLYTKD